MRNSKLSNWDQEQFQLNTIKIPASYFVDTDKLISVYMECQKTQKQWNPWKEQSWRTSTTQLQDFYKAAVIKTVRCWQRADKQINGTGQTAQEQMHIHQSTDLWQWSKDSLSNGAKVLEYHMQKINLDTDLVLFTKINPKQIIALSVKCNTSQKLT